MKKKFFKFLKYLFTILLAVVLVTISINATDNYGNISRSFIYRAVFGPDKSICPDDMVYVNSEQKSFCLDKYENSAGKGCPYSDPNNSEETRSNLDVLDCHPVAEAGRIPWRNISLDQAANACAKAGKRLPTPQEWYQGSLGTPDLKNNWGQDDCQVNKNWDSQPGKSGSAKNCISGFGAYDMIGNVWEWVNAEIKDGNFNSRAMPEQGYIDSLDIDTLPLTTNSDKPNLNFNEDYYWIKMSGSRAIARGGYWDNQAEGGRSAVYSVSALAFAGNGVSFRCVK